MTEVLINANIKPRKQTELFQTIESIKDLLLKKCSHFDFNCEKNRMLKMQITFNETLDTEENFNVVEFSILKGALLSLCDDVEIVQDKNNKIL